MLIRSISAAVLSAALVLPAGAADYSRYQPFEFRPAIHDWTGAYAGLHGGWGWGRFSGTLEISGTPENGDPFSVAHNGAIDADGYVVGLQTGYGIQLDPLYLGIEADLSYARIGGDRAWPFTVENVVTKEAVYDDDVLVEEEVIEAVDRRFKLDGRTEWLGTFRSRVGLPIDDMMIYGTAGIAVGGVRMAGFGETKRTIRFGWTAGGGFELALDGGWWVRGEYLYYDLGKKTYAFNASLPEPMGGPVRIVGEADFTGHVVRAGLNYHFGE